jgi:hypothetical protein
MQGILSNRWSAEEDVMRLHPAVATALVLVGGVLLALPLYEWFRFAAVRSVSADTPSWSVGASLVSGALGLVFIFVAIVFSIESQSGSRVAD